jgi:hypothetical protein
MRERSGRPLGNDLFIDRLELEIGKSLRKKNRVPNVPEKKIIKYCVPGIWEFGIWEFGNLQNQKICEKILKDQLFGGLVKEFMMRKVYYRFNENARLSV